MKIVAFVLFPEFLLLDMAGPMEVFSIANRYLAPDQTYQVCTVAATPTVRASNGVVVQAQHLVDQLPGDIELLLVPGGPGAYNDSHEPLLPWLRMASRQSRRYGSICTGAFILGQAGLLDGHHATTHWHYTERLQKRYPLAKVCNDQIYIHDDRLVTSGGVTAGIDLALSMVAELHGKKVALDVAKVLLVVMRRQGGQAQFSPLVAAVAGQESPITRVQDYVLARLEEAFSVERMAEVAAMSTRHFARVFAREVGTTPMEFLQSARIDRARSLLETTELPLKTVAWRSGFGSVRHMRFLFGEKLGLTPLQYRLQFN